MDYDPERKGLAALLVSADMRKAMTEAAGDGADVARAHAPVDTGAYRRSIRVEQAGYDGPRRADRVAVDIVADIEYGAVIEFGALDNSPSAQKVLATAIDAIQRR